MKTVINFWVFFVVISFSTNVKAQDTLLNQHNQDVLLDSLSDSSYYSNLRSIAVAYIDKITGGKKYKDFLKGVPKMNFNEAMFFLYKQQHRDFEVAFKHILNSQEWEVYRHIKLELLPGYLEDNSPLSGATTASGEVVFKYSPNFLFNLIDFLLSSKYFDSTEIYMKSLYRLYNIIDKQAEVMTQGFSELVKPIEDPVGFVSFALLELQRNLIFSELHELYHFLPANKNRQMDLQHEIEADSFGLDKYRELILLTLADTTNCKCPDFRKSSFYQLYPKDDVTVLQLLAIQIFDYLISEKWDLLIDYKESIGNWAIRWGAILERLQIYGRCNQRSEDGICRQISAQRKYILDKANRMKHWASEYKILDTAKLDYTFATRNDLYNYSYTWKYYISKGNLRSAVQFLENNIPKIKDSGLKEYSYLVLGKLYWSYLKRPEDAKKIYKEAKKIGMVVTLEFYDQMLYLLDIELAKSRPVKSHYQAVAGVTQLQKIFDEKGTTNALFGASVALSDDVILLGSPNSGENCYLFGRDLSCRGSVQVFEKKGKIWKNSYALTPPTSKSGGFGNALSIYKHVALVGASNEDKQRGLVYLLKKKYGKWSIDLKINGSKSKHGDHFGQSISIYENFVAIGAPDANGGKGEVYIFERKGTGWREKSILKAPNEKPGVRFGRSVSLYGNLLAVGTIFDTDNGIKSGSVSLFILRNDEWVFYKKIIPSDGKPDARFGKSVSLYKDELLVGAVYDSSECEECGSAYFFKKINELEWSEFKVIPGNLTDNAGFGSSVALYNDYAVIGAERQNSNGRSSGKAYLYHYSNEEKKWKEAGGLIGDSVDAFDFFGTVGLFKDLIIVGADFGDGKVIESGCAYIFSVNNK